MVTTPLPPPGDADVLAHVEMSNRFLKQARNELQVGDRVQASEKVWGAAAHALKAIGIQRGWHHRTHGNVNAIGGHLARERDNRDISRYLVAANAMHQNFYENNLEADTIADAIADVEQLIARLDEVRTSPPQPFTVSDRVDQRRLVQLLGLPQDRPPPIGAQSNVGFSRAHPDNGEDLTATETT